MTAVDHQTGEVVCASCGIWLQGLPSNERYDMTTWALGCPADRREEGFIGAVNVRISGGRFVQTL